MFEYFSKKISRNFKFHCNLTGIQGILHKNLMYIYDNISLNFFRKRNVSGEVVEKIKTHVMYFHGCTVHQ